MILDCHVWYTQVQQLENQQASECELQHEVERLMVKLFNESLPNPNNAAAYEQRPEDNKQKTPATQHSKRNLKKRKPK